MKVCLRSVDKPGQEFPVFAWEGANIYMPEDKKMDWHWKREFPIHITVMPYILWKKKEVIFWEPSEEIMSKIMQWKNKLLMFEGSHTLIKHYLQSLPIYLMSVMNPPKGVINQIHRIMAKFFWESTSALKKTLVAW